MKEEKRDEASNAGSPLIQPLDEHNRKLLQNVHPSGWKNPEPSSCYNLVVIGAGTAGLVTAAGAAGLGAKVALIERDLLGGDCLNTGCVPSKAIIRAGRAAHESGTASGFGVNCSDVTVDFAKAMDRMRQVRAGISAHDSAARFSKELGVDVFLGSARFIGTDSVEVDGARLRFKKAAICTGTRAAVPPVPGLDESGYLTNETVFHLTELPQRLGIIGGGPIGCELAQAFARLGSRVSILAQGKQLLPREDADAAIILQNSLERDGVIVKLRTSVDSVAVRGKEKVITIGSDGTRTALVFDQILVAIGRRPNIEGLDLEKGGIAYDAKQGIIVNDRLQTGNRNVYAAGDICSPYKFTHTADAMARIVIANALFMARQKMSDLVIPWCTFTDPEIAHVGLHEKQAREQGAGVHTFTVPVTAVDRMVLDDETEGFARVHLRKGTDRILGATIVARHAGELISEICLAMTAKTGLSSIGRTIHPYPTRSEVVKKLADQYNRTRLTPFLKKLFSAWFRWQRSSS